MLYRPDIDGLRAVSIAAVVLFHAFPNALPGGFVGVDIFFVISGFLITGIIRRPGFSLADFYSRRIRRIFPALLLVMCATSALAVVVLPDAALRAFWFQAIGGAIFAANIFAYLDTGYFSGAANLKPFLHLWSLGVEEQFYVVWPLLLMLVRGRRLIVGCFVVSLAFCIWQTSANMSAAFYLAPARAWELLAGAALVGVALPARHQTAAGVAGLALLALSFGFIDSGDAFPGLLAVLPVAGAALVIASPESRFRLDARPLVFLGLISYPLYLWHWPLLALLRNVQKSPTAAAVVAAIALSLVLAVLTRRFLEVPSKRLRPRAAVAGLCSAMLALALFGCGNFAAAPALPRGLAYPKDTESCTARYQWNPGRGWWVCAMSKASPPTIALLGDSHAAHLYSGITQVMRTESIVHVGACAPNLGVTYLPLADAPNYPCVRDEGRAAGEYINAHVLREPSLKLVVLSACWVSFDDEGNEVDYSTGEPRLTFERAGKTAMGTYTAGLERQVTALGDMPIVLVLDNPRYGLPFDLQMQRQRVFRAAVAAIAQRHPNVRVFDPMEVLCPGGVCDKTAVWDDGHHLSITGSYTVAKAIAPLLVDMRSAR